MRRNYAQTSRGAARPNASAGRRRPTESYSTSGRGGRSGARRMSSQPKKNNQGVVIGLIIACAVIVLAVIVFAVSGSDNPDPQNTAKDTDQEQQPASETGNIVSNTPKETSKDPVISKPKKENKNFDEEDFDDDDDWSRKDPDFKGKNLGNRDKFKK